MRKVLPVAAACLLACLTPSRSFAWGAAAHRDVMRRAIARLPPDIKPFFDRVGDEVVLRVNDPDLWRNVPWPEDPNHFLNFGAAELGPYPFELLPREYGAALEKFGAQALDRIGRLPWREQEEYGNLRRAFERMGRGAPYAVSDTVLFSAVAAHYLQDAYEPLHATNNYDGQLTQQNGIHSRFETALFERFGSRLTLAPPPVRPITSPRDAAFTALLESYRRVQPILDADRAAVAGRSSYDDDYFEQFFAKAKPVLEERLSQAISATAALIVGAWEAAGRPSLRIDVSRSPQKVRVRPGVRPGGATGRATRYVQSGTGRLPGAPVGGS
jgi:hypothetical protein